MPERYGTAQSSFADPIYISTHLNTLKRADTNYIGKRSEGEGSISPTDLTTTVLEER